MKEQNLQEQFDVTKRVFKRELVSILALLGGGQELDNLRFSNAELSHLIKVAIISLKAENKTLLSRDNRIRKAMSKKAQLDLIKKPDDYE